MEWNSGMVEYWNGGMTTPTKRDDHYLLRTVVLYESRYVPRTPRVISTQYYVYVRVSGARGAVRCTYVYV